MNTSKFDLILDAQRRNFRLTQFTEAVLEPFETPRAILREFNGQKAGIETSRHLTAEGKAAALVALGKATTERIAKWHAPLIAGVDRDLALRRAALLPPSAKPDPRAIEFLLSRLRDRTPQEIATLYDKAADGERRLMEDASASVGRIPMKGADGLQWRPLLDHEAVNESVMARAAASNPAGAASVRELAEIRALHVSIASIAAAEVRDALPGHNLETE
jgi:hypothetical protein